jgi:transposase
LPSSILEALWVQVAALLPTRRDAHPLGCHRPRIPDRVIFDKLIQILVFGCGYRRIADATCSASTLRRRRDEWTTAGWPSSCASQCSAPTSGYSAWNLSTWRWMGASPRRPAAGRPLGPARSTAASRA